MHWFWDNDLAARESYAWALLALLVLEVPALVKWLALRVRRRPDSNSQGAYMPFFSRLANGADGKWSTSKTMVLVWTYSLGFAFLTWVFWMHNADVANGGSDVVDWQYLVVLGVPAGSALWTKYNTVQKLASGEITKGLEGAEANPFAGARDLVSNDQGRADLLDFQYVFFNLILLASFFASFLHAPGNGLPNLPNVLLSLTGVSAGAYVVKKSAERDVTPVIRSITPPSLPAGSPNAAQILGTGLVDTVEPADAQAAKPKIVLRAVPDDATKPLWSVPISGQVKDRGGRNGVQRVEVQVPPGTLPGKYTIVVTGPTGQDVEHDFDVV